jgi:hypothetical protein
MDRTFDRVVSVGVVLGATAATMATATIWLLLTNPVGIASALVDRNTVALLQQIAGATYDAVVTVLQYL